MVWLTKSKFLSLSLSLVFGLFLLLPDLGAAESANVMFVLDASGSMWGQVDGKAKINIAKDVLKDLLDGLPQDMQVGLIAYGHRSKGDCEDIEMLVPVGPMDTKILKAKVAGLNAKGKTPLSAAVERAATALRYTEEKATVILVSDGVETCNADPCKLAAELAASGVDFTVHVIGFDIRKEEHAQLKCLADTTGGLFLAAGDDRSLRDALAQTVNKVKEPPKPVVADPGTAQLAAPATVAAGSSFEVVWQGPDSRDDFIALATRDHKDRTYRYLAYTERGNPGLLTAPGAPGEYQLRYVHAETGKIIGTADIEVTPVQAELQAPSSVSVAAEFDVIWQGPGYEGDHITICLPDDPAGTYRNYQYTDGGTPAKLRAPSDPGTYEIRYIMATDTTVLARRSITVDGVGAEVESPEFVDMAAEFEVSWQGPSNTGDYISIASPEDGGGSYKAYTYTKQGSPLKLRAPSDPGQYEVRYILGQGNRVLASTPITVLGVVAHIESPENVDVAAEFEVSWQGPSNDKDYISIALPGDGGGVYKAYTYTRKGNPLKLQAPSDPGEYEVRYILGQGNKILAKAPVTINAVSAQVQAPAEVAAKADFAVEWQGPGYSRDYVTIVPENAGEGEYLSYFYTKDGNPGNLAAPAEPGVYEVRYIMEPGRKVLAKTRVVVK